MADKKILTDISPQAFEHPLDRTALAALRKIKGFDWLVRKFITGQLFEHATNAACVGGFFSPNGVASGESFIN